VLLDQVLEAPLLEVLLLVLFVFLTSFFYKYALSILIAIATIGIVLGAVWFVLFSTLFFCIIAFQFPAFRYWLKIEYQQLKTNLFWRGENGEYTFTFVWYASAIAALPNRLDIILENNINAINPSWSELLKFLKQDKTATQAYVENKFVCANFALTVHNNAEIAGWRCALVLAKLSGVLHALNAFQTTDYGLIYIDCTNNEQGLKNSGRIVNLSEGKEYIPKSIFSDDNWGNPTSMGIISKIKIYW